MGFSLEIGEVAPDAWDWITFNNRNEGSFSPEVLDGASLLIPLQIEARGADPPAAAQCQSLALLTFFPVAKSEDGILGCCLNSLPSCMGSMLNLGRVVGERGYSKCSGRYPRTVFSALFDSGFVVITDSGLEDLRTASGCLRSIIVHPDDPDVVRRPIEVEEVRCCISCAKPLAECECTQKEVPVTAKSLERSWKSLEHLELRERIIAFQKMRHNAGLFRATLTTTKDATWFSRRPGMATLKQVGFTLYSEGALLQKMKVNFACRLARQSSPRGMLLTADDRPAVQATRRGRSPVKASTTGLMLSCDICGANFSRRSGLHRHRRTVHEAVRDFPCGVCGKAFTLRQHLQTHVEAVHEKRRDHSCDACGVSFPTASKLSRHTRGVHLREKSFRCELCGRLFFQQSDLLRHQRRNDHAPTTAGAEKAIEQ